MKTNKIFMTLLWAVVLLLCGCSDKNDDHSIDTYSITVTAGENGSASANVEKAKEGETVTLTAKADPGYIFSKWTVTKGEIKFSTTLPSATFEMPAQDVAIEAEFVAQAPDEYAITITDDGNGTAKATVNNVAVTRAAAGTVITIEATPVDGYDFVKWTVTKGGVTLDNPTEQLTTFTMPSEAVEIGAEFAAQAPDEYAITITDDGNGTAKATVNNVAVTRAAAGTVITIEATPADGYEFSEWTVTKGGVTLSPDNATAKVTFTMPGEDVEIRAEFVKKVGVLINGLVWAECNVGEFGEFVANPEDYGCFYQWNRPQAWPADGNVVDWDDTYPGGVSWESANDPCPNGWRVPTYSEFQSLLDDANVDRGWTTQNNTNGYKFTDKATGASLFLPAMGYRGGYNGGLGQQGTDGYYFAAGAYSDGNAWYLFFYEDYAGYGYMGRFNGLSVRCVHQ